MKRISTILFTGFLISNIYSQDKPNFIIILADDLGYGDLGYTGSKEVQTPNIDKLAKSATVLRNGYVTSSVCSPSRAGLITGRNQVYFGHDNNIEHNQPGFDPAYLGLNTEVNTLADYLKDLGYVNGLIGKWHLGEEEQFHPLNRGFDFFWGYTNGGHDYFEIDSNDNYYKRPIECNYKAEPVSISYITDDTGDECVEFINSHKAEPFFLFASFNAPHTPLQAKPEHVAMYEHIEKYERRVYLAMVHSLDENVGKIIDAIELNGISNNTVIVFLSDNGGPVDNNFSTNTPFNGQKGTLFEGGIRVPFFIKVPMINNQIPELKTPIVSYDIVPTFLSYAGVSNLEEFNFDGISIKDYLNKKNNQFPDRTLMWRFTIGACIIEDNWKLIRLPDRLPMLFNLADDISEQNDISLENIEKTKSLLKKLGEWDVNAPHPLFLEGAEWKLKNLERYDKDYFK